MRRHLLDSIFFIDGNWDGLFVSCSGRSLLELGMTNGRHFSERILEIEGSLFLVMLTYSNCRLGLSSVMSTTLAFGLF